MNPEPKFLTVEQVEALHRIQIDEFGGTHGVRDEGLLLSALAQPESYSQRWQEDNTKNQQRKGPPPRDASAKYNAQILRAYGPQDKFCRVKRDRI